MSGISHEERLMAEEQEELREREHFTSVLRAFLYYTEHASKRVARATRSFHLLPLRHQNMLPGFVTKTQTMAAAIAANTNAIEMLVDMSKGWAGVPEHEWVGLPKGFCASEFDMDKVYTTLKQFTRDWSEAGAREREQAYSPILDEIDRRFKERDRAGVSVLVPGAGLGRLAWEFASRGYRCQGNEWSSFMLFASNFAMNAKPGARHTKIYPFAHIFTNHHKVAFLMMVDDQLQSIEIPDVDTCSLPADGGGFSMAAGDFCEIYTEEASWDCIASSFFVDTARNPIDYLETMFKIIKPGGVLVNLGPLLYHFNDDRELPSLELSYDELKQAMIAVGFKVIEERFLHDTWYNLDPQSMMQMVYRCVFFVAQKPLDTEELL